MRTNIRKFRLALTSLTLVVLLFLVLGPVPALAQTPRYVAPTGTDVGDCSNSASPCQTIKYAIGQANAGDIVNVAAGTYDENLVIQKSIHLVGEDKDTTILTYTGTPTVEQLIMLGWNTGGTLASGATVQGFKLVADVGLDGDKDLIKLRANGASGAPIVIKDNIFQGDGNTRYLGIETAYDAGYVNVENNEFYNLAYGAWFNVLTDATIQDNIIDSSWYTGLAICTGDVGVTHDIDITDNTIVNSGTAGGSHIWNSGMHLGSTIYNMNVQGNTIRDGSGYSVVIHDRNTTDLSNVHINCNNIYNNPDGFLNGVSTSVDAENNWWDDASGPGGVGPGTGDAVSDNVDYDPWLSEPVGDVCPPPPVIEVAIDIKPGSCPNPLNVKKKGVLPVAILGTSDFDVAQVDPASVELEGVSVLRWDLEDVATPFEPFTGKEEADDCTDEGPDGFLDLTLKFDAQEIVAALGDVNDGDVLVLTLTGNLLEEFDGTPIQGEDVVVILKKGKE